MEQPLNNESLLNNATDSALVAELKRGGWQHGIVTTLEQPKTIRDLLPSYILVKRVEAFAPQLELPSE